MIRMRKIAAMLLALLLLVGTATACQPAADTTDTTAASPEETTDAPAPDTEAPTEPITDTSSDTLPSDLDPDDPPAQAQRPAEEVKVVSFNLDANAQTAGERSQRLIPLILGFDADSIGVQEARTPWGALLKRYLESEGYGRIGVDANGQSPNDSGVFATYIFYKTDKYTVVDSGTFWMSKTPETPSQYDHTVDCNRTCTWAVLENKETGFRYVHMNTHLDWMNMNVNAIQVAMIREQIERFELMGYPVFATGDYNCDEGSASYKTMLKSPSIADAKHVAEISMDLGTYPSYGQYDVTVSEPIDFVFVTKNTMQVLEYKVIDDKPEGEYVSDHNGLFVHALVNALPVHTEGDDKPAYSADAALTYTPVGSTAIDVVIPQAQDANGVPAYEYLIELRTDSADTRELTVSSGVLRLEHTATVAGRIAGLTPNVPYTISVTPLSILGVRGTPLTLTCRLEAPTDSTEMPAADLFDLGFVDGKPVDVSPNGYELTAKGSAPVVTIDGKEAIEFKGSGNYRIPGFKENYTVMEMGFTLEVSFTTGADVSTFQSLVSNMHAGGFGMDIEGGQVQFSLRSSTAGKYIGVKAPIEANTTYHVVGVFDGTHVTIYLNGAEMAKTNFSGQMVHPTDPGARYLCLGADSSADGNGEYGIIATLYTVRIYSVAATAAQALYLYEQASK